jgi:hypothetical protein
MAISAASRTSPITVAISKTSTPPCSPVCGRATRSRTCRSRSPWRRTPTGASTRPGGRSTPGHGHQHRPAPARQLTRELP